MSKTTRKIYLTLLFCFLFLFSCANKDKSTDGKEGKENSTLNANLSQGQRQYHLRGCVKCHGVLGNGNGSKARLLGVKPRNFTDLSSYKQGYSVEEISKTLEVGITSNPKSLMPKYPFLTLEEREQIALYVVFLSTNQNSSQ